MEFGFTIAAYAVAAVLFILSLGGLSGQESAKRAVWYGIVGGLIAWLATAVLIWWLDSAVRNISQLYESQFSLQGLTLNEMMVLWLLAIGLGLLGSYLAVRKHVAAIEPQ